MSAPSALFRNRQKAFYRNFVTEFSKPSFNTLAQSDFRKDFFDRMENAARNNNRIFVGQDGKPIGMMLFGEITHSSLGTQLDCKGNHYMSTDNVCCSLLSSTILFIILLLSSLSTNQNQNIASLSRNRHVRLKTSASYSTTLAMNYRPSLVG